MQFSTLILIIFQSDQYFWEYDVIFSNFQPRIGTKKINGGLRFTEIKVQKNVRSTLRNRLKFGKMSREDLLCTKMYKNVQKCISKIWSQGHFKQFNRWGTNSGVHQNACRLRCLITPVYLYIVLTLSCAVTKLTHKTLIFHDFQGSTILIWKGSGDFCKCPENALFSLEHLG